MRKCHVRHNWVAGTLLTLAAVALAAPAGAIPWAEVDDAGELGGTAQVTVGTGPLTSIDGAMFGLDVADLYLIYIDDPAGFSATTVGLITTMDSQLFLFDSAGVGIYANDNSADLNFPFQSTLPAGDPNSPTAVGDYLLGISSLNYDPLDAGAALIFPDVQFGVFGPNSSNPLAGWAGRPFDDGEYSIALTGASFAQAASVPEPGTALLMGAGLIGLAFLVRRRESPGD